MYIYENDEEFWKHIAHTGELSLDDARKFIATISSETTGISYEEALVFANEILEQSGRTEYVEARHVAPPRNVNRTIITLRIQFSA